MITMPVMPTATPPRRRGPVGIPNPIQATSTAAIGIALLSIPVIDESIHCCAIGNNESGSAIHVTPSNPTRLHARRGMGWRAAGSRERVANPKPTRSKVTRPGSKSSSAIAMNKNDAPQIDETMSRNDQSDDAIGLSSARGSLCTWLIGADATGAPSAAPPQCEDRNEARCSSQIDRASQPGR